MRSVYIPVFVLYLFSKSFHCLEWDTIVDRSYPKSCSRDQLFDKSRDRSIRDPTPAVTQSEAYAFVRLGKRVAKTMDEIDQDAETQPFPNLALQHFFTSTLTPEVRSASAASKANLMATKIMINKKTSCGNMTPNNFVTFLETNGFIGAFYKKISMCGTSGAKLQFRMLDGSCNNVANPLWGAAKKAFTRIAPHNYCDGIYSMPISKSGRTLPSPRKISTKIMKQEVKLSNVLSAMSVYWGQLVAHDMSMRVMEQHSSGGGIQCCSTDGSQLLTGNSLHPACAPIHVSPDDPFYSRHNVLYLNFVRSLTVPNGKDTLGPAEQMNSVSSYLDCSPIYGADPIIANSLRTFTSGYLKMTENGYPPVVRNASSLCDTSKGYCPCYLTGDSRVNQTPGLTALQVLLLREHNRIAKILTVLNNHWDDERIYQEARRIVIAEVQHITYREWLPLILGRDYLKKYRIAPNSLFTYDYDSNVNAGVINSFAGAAFRFFHTLVPGDILMNHGGNNAPTIIKLSDQYMKPCILEHYTKAVDALLKGAVEQAALEANAGFTPELTNLLFKSSSKWGLDLVALDVQRGRDHGLATYNTFRSTCGLKKAYSFDDLAEEISQERIHALKKVYDNVDDIDLFVGGLLESDVYGAVLGPTFQCIIGEQFYRTRVGDRYFYDVGDLPHSFTSDQMKQIKKASMARLICDNCKVDKIQKFAFEKPGQYNPVHNCKTTNSIEEVDFKYWKEF